MDPRMSDSLAAEAALSPDQERRANAAGIAWMVVAGVLFVLVTATVRYIGTNLPAPVAAFMRYLMGLIMLLPMLLRLSDYRPSPRALMLYGVRGLVHGLGVILWFFAMARIPIAQVTAIGYLAPIFITVGAALFLGETMHVRRIMAVLAGFAGAMLVIRPGFAQVSIGQLAQLAAAPLFAVSYLTAKILTRSEKPTVIVGVLTITSTLALAPFAIANWQTPSLHETLFLTLTAFFATTGHYALTRAFQAAALTVTQPFAFLQLLWASLLGMAMFGEPFDPWVIAGGGVIVAAVTYIAHREAVAGRRSRAK
jgi:drug/metabolite transporter (DMT)-like permease